MQGSITLTFSIFCTALYRCYCIELHICATSWILRKKKLEQKKKTSVEEVLMSCTYVKVLCCANVLHYKCYLNKGKKNN